MYAGTFSKVLARRHPGGLLHGPSAVCQKMIVCKQGEDVHTNILAQMIANEFMTKYDYPAPYPVPAGPVPEKAKFAMDLMDSVSSPKITYKPIQAALFIWRTSARRGGYA